MKEVIGNMCERCNTIYLSEQEAKLCEEICLLKNKLKEASILAKENYEQKLINEYCASKKILG